MCESDLRAHKPCPVLQSWFLANMWCHWSARAHWSRLEISAIRHRKRLLPFFKELQDAPRPKEMHSPVNHFHGKTLDRVNNAIPSRLLDSHVSSRATIVPSERCNCGSLILYRCICGASRAVQYRGSAWRFRLPTYLSPSAILASLIQNINNPLCFSLLPQHSIHYFASSTTAR
jgi:hypothetical protein